MFERFTDRARRVVVLAQEEARMHNHNYIGTEHLLLGIIREGEGVGAKALSGSYPQVTLEAVRKDVEEIIGFGQFAPSGHIPFTPRAKKTLELSLRQALRLGHNYIGTEHLLLGLVAEGEGVGCTVLVRLGVNLPNLRLAVIDAVENPGQLRAPAEPAEERLGDPTNSFAPKHDMPDTVSDKATASVLTESLGEAPPEPSPDEGIEVCFVMKRGDLQEYLDWISTWPNNPIAQMVTDHIEGAMT